jgi:diacylglycerol kinase (ATP)
MIDDGQKSYVLMSKKILLVINPKAGNGKAGRKSTIFLKAADELGITTTIVNTSGEGKMLKEIEEAITNERFNALIAVGGDGLVHSLLPIAVSSKLPFGVIPAGTGNDFARSVGGFHLPISQLLKSIMQDSYTSIDLMKIKSAEASSLSAQILSLGFDALVNERANTFRHLKGRAKYVLAMVRELSFFKPQLFTVTVDGVAHERRAMLIAVANGPNYGGGMKIVPQADHSDGLLDVLILNKVSTFELLRVFPKVYKGSHINHPAIELIQGSSIHVDAQAKAYADGEFVGDLPIQIDVAPHALRVLR